jgi:tripartite-type tricarboxylate transporter receptor subunit TctC
MTLDALEEAYLQRPDMPSLRPTRNTSITVPDRTWQNTAAGGAAAASTANSLSDRRVTLADLVQGRAKGRTSADQITYSERGNLQGHSSLRSPARSTRRPNAPDWAAKSRPNGSSRTSGIKPMLLHRLTFAFAGVAGCLLLAGPAAAQEAAAFYKGKTLKIVVGFSPAGGYDQYGRLVARHLGRHIPGNPNIIVQNMPGAASLKSVQYLSAGAPADGTLIVTFNAGLITQSLTAPAKVPVKFLDYGWVGNVSEDFRVCFTWNGTGIKNWQGFVQRDKVTFGNTGVGTSAYIDDRMLSDLFGVKMHAVMGYPGSADKRIAIERGELDGDCGSWTSMPDEWLRDHKVTLLIRFSKTLAPGMPASLPFAGDLLTDPKKRQVLALLTAGAMVGRPFIVPKGVPAERLKVLQAAFDATMKDPDFLADAAKQKLLVTPMTGADCEAFIKELHQTPPEIIAAAKTISGQ